VPGLGESAAAERLDARTFNGWLAGLLRLTCDERPTLLVHSLVGTLTARFAIERGDLLRRLVIWSVPGVGRYRMPLGLAVAAARSGIRPSPGNLARFARWPFHDLERSRLRDPAWFELFFAYTLACARQARTKRSMRQLIGAGTRRIPTDELRAIGTPTTLLWGEHDRMVPFRLAEVAAARLAWPLRIISGAGHVPHLEQPDAFVAAVHEVVRHDHD
jgi:pimeloyl-ACP methyl ester carboxylesterase